MEYRDIIMGAIAINPGNQEHVGASTSEMTQVGADWSPWDNVNVERGNIPDFDDVRKMNDPKELDKYMDKV